jgi:hypothetical protein
MQMKDKMLTNAGQLDVKKSNAEADKPWNGEAPDLARHIRMIPEPSVPDGFVEAAMADWRKSRRAMPVPADPVPLSWPAKVKIVIRQGFWRDCFMGVLLFAVVSGLLRISELVPALFILPVAGGIPLLVVLSATARQALCRMGELTRSLRLPLHWYLQVRLLLVGAVCILVNGIAAALLYPYWGGEVLARAALLWCIPTLLNAAIALVLSARIREFAQLVTLLMLLPVCWLVLASNGSFYKLVSSVSIQALCLHALAAAVIAAAAVMINSRDLRKGGYLVGA